MNGNLADDELITQGQVDEGEIRHILMKEKSCPLTMLLRPAVSCMYVYNIQLGYKLRLINIQIFGSLIKA